MIARVREEDAADILPKTHTCDRCETIVEETSPRREKERCQSVVSEVFFSSLLDRSLPTSALAPLRCSSVKCRCAPSRTRRRRNRSTRASKRRDFLSFLSHLHPFDRHPQGVCSTIITKDSVDTDFLQPCCLIVTFSLSSTTTTTTTTRRRSSIDGENGDVGNK